MGPAPGLIEILVFSTRALRRSGEVEPGQLINTTLPWPAEERGGEAYNLFFFFLSDMRAA